MSATRVRSYGNNTTDRNVFAFLTDQNLSSLVKYKAYDNDQTFPTTDTVTTTAHPIFSKGVHTTGSSIYLVDTTNAAPSSDWMADVPASDTAENNPNILLGDDNYVEQDGSILTAASRATFNMCIRVNNTVTTSDNMQFDVAVEYTYTGTAPSPSFQYSPQGASEGTPAFATITGTEGVVHCRSGSGPSGGDFYANIPASGTEDTAEAWVVTAGELP